jgi:drug/metabolite transporter (DMT)-like permease
MVGIALLCELDINNFNRGDLYITVSAAFFSLHILAIDKYAKGQNSFYFNLWQCVYVGIMGFIFASLYVGIPSFEPALRYTDITKQSAFLGFIVLAIFSSIIAFGIQVKVQEKIRPHIVSVIFLMESVFASFFGYIFFGETLSLMGLIGCCLILLSVFLISRLLAK